MLVRETGASGSREQFVTVGNVWDTSELSRLCSGINKDFLCGFVSTQETSVFSLYTENYQMLYRGSECGHKSQSSWI